jgi:hypothetical protein
MLSRPSSRPHRKSVPKVLVTSNNAVLRQSACRPPFSGGQFLRRPSNRTTEPLPLATWLSVLRQLLTPPWSPTKTSAKPRNCSAPANW